MGKLKKEDYDSIIKRVFEKSIIEFNLKTIEDFATELVNIHNNEIIENPDFVENIHESFKYYVVDHQLDNLKNRKAKRAFDLYLSRINGQTNFSANPSNLQDVKLKWNGDSKQLYHLIKQLTTLKTGEDVPFISNTLDEIADFISLHFEGINSKPDSIRSAISRSNISPKKGKRLIIEVK